MEKATLFESHTWHIYFVLEQKKRVLVTPVAYDHVHLGTKNIFYFSQSY